MSEYQELLGSQKVPKVSIPRNNDNPTVCNLLLYDLAFTESAVKKAKDEGRDPNLMDGIVAKMVVLEYFVNNQKYTCIDYSDLESIKFPCDVTGADGLKQFCGIGNNEFLNTWRITKMKGKNSHLGGFSMPQSNKTCAIAYDYSFKVQYGTPEYMLVNMILKEGLVKDLKADSFSELPKGDNTYPILTVYSYLDFVYPKGSWSKQGKDWILKEGAKESQPEIVYTCYNRKEKKVDLKFIEKNVLSEDVTLKIYEALRLRSKEKAEQEKATETPF